LANQKVNQRCQAPLVNFLIFVKNKNVLYL
jgi:hypothetical protein